MLERNAFNGLVARAFEDGTTLPDFVYNGKVRSGVKVHEIKLDTLAFVGKIESPEFYGKPEYRTFNLDKVQA